MLASAHSGPSVAPARSAALPGYHISRTPAPVAGTDPIPNVPPRVRPAFLKTVSALAKETPGWPLPTTKSGSVSIQLVGLPDATLERPTTKALYAWAVVPWPKAAE